LRTAFFEYRCGLALAVNLAVCASGQERKEA
jgi:hypothetical protein